MITMYDAPKKVKLTDLFPDSGRKYYIQKFEYGDFDNWVTAVIYETSLVINDYSLNSKAVKDGKYSAYLATTFIALDGGGEIGKDFINSGRKFVGCGNDLKISKLEDLTDFEVTVDGEWTRD